MLSTRSEEPAQNCPEKWRRSWISIIECVFKEGDPTNDKWGFQQSMPFYALFECSFSLSEVLCAMARSASSKTSSDQKLPSVESEHDFSHIQFEDATLLLVIMLTYITYIFINYSLSSMVYRGHRGQLPNLYTKNSIISQLGINRPCLLFLNLIRLHDRF